MPFDITPQFNDPTLTRLWQARAYLGQGEEYWCKTVEERGISRCALGAMRIDGKCSGVAELYLYACVPHRRLYCHVPDYNDSIHTTYHDVLALFDRAIAKREAELLAAA